MNHHRLFGYILPFALAALCFVPLNTSAQYRRTSDREVLMNVSPTLSLTAENSAVTSCATGESAQVKLNARTTSAAGQSIRYRWSATSGRIVGDGPVVTWDLTGLAPGYYKAFVEIETGDTNEHCEAFSSTNVLVNECPPPPPVCPNVAVTCPTDVAVDQPITFSSNVTGGTPESSRIYNWAVSAGTIIEGQGTSTIKVDTKGLAGQTIRATLSIEGFPQACVDSCSVQIPIPQASCRKFDEFPTIARNDEKARLDNYGVELQNDPTSTAYVIVFPGRSGQFRDVQKQTTRIVDYLVNTRGIDAKRIVTLVGSTRDELRVELWACPQGATPPKP